MQLIQFIFVETVWNGSKRHGQTITRRIKDRFDLVAHEGHRLKNKVQELVTPHRNSLFPYSIIRI